MSKAIYSNEFKQLQGYKADDMILVSKDLAKTLFNDFDMGVYQLLETGIESLVTDPEQLEESNHFGVEVNAYNMKTLLTHLLDQKETIDDLSWEIYALEENM